MVKIRELSDKQLVSQLEKYEKIYGQLVGERDKRVQTKGSDKGLLTLKEIELKKLNEPEPEAEEVSENTQAFQVKFDDDELSGFDADNEALASKPEEEEDEVRVTQLLKLSKEQLEELRNPQPKKVVKKKKVLKKKNG
ncbi:MAG: hypothetical protein NXH75_01545 [Halobacteriovoraceae bacterium]|nr:hypothetical protein [Halobacteriovoraceae bacterium]